jgi:hypothetical protein
MRDVLAIAGEEIVEAQYGVSALQQELAEMRTDKASTSRYKNAPLLQMGRRLFHRYYPCKAFRPRSFGKCYGRL